MTKKIGVIGDKSSVLPFQFFGFDVRHAVSSKEIRLCIEEMAAADYGIIFITEAAALQAEKSIARYKQAISPAIILIPGREGSQGIGLAAIQENVERAIGQNIL